MSPESSGGRESPRWTRLKNSRATIFGQNTSAKVITNNPGEQHPVSYIQTPWGSLHPLDLRSYQLNPDGSFTIPGVKSENNSN